MPDPTPAASLFRKLAEIMAEIGHVPKRGRNDFHKYDYVTEADLVDAVRQKLAERNVFLIPSAPETIERPGQKNATVTTVRMTFTFVDGDTGAMYSSEWMGSGEDGGDKGLYKAYTGAVKYFLMKTFLIPTGDDPEADSKTDKRGQGQQKPKPKGFIGKAEEPVDLDDKGRKMLDEQLDRYVAAGGDYDQLCLKGVSIGCELGEIDVWSDVSRQQGLVLYKWMQQQVDGVEVPSS